MADRGDLEDRVGAALAHGARRAPDVGGLTDRARARSSRRRRTRARVLVGASALAVILAAVPLALLGDGASAPVGGEAAGGGWRTVEVELELPSGPPRTLLVDVPAAWAPTSSDCHVDVALAGRCDDEEGLSLVVDTGSQDFASGPGLRPAADHGHPDEAGWSGYVTVGPDDGILEGYAVVASGERQTALRVLGSVRAPGEDLPGLEGAWPVTVEKGVAWSAPAGVSTAVGVEPSWNGPRGGYGFRGFAGSSRAAPWAAVKEVGDQVLRVVAPTRALAEVVAGSAGPDDGVVPVDAWTTRTVDGVTLDVPPRWVRLDTGACRFGQTRFGPVGTEPCATPAPLAVFGSGSYDNVAPPGLDPGYVLTGDQVVTAEGDPDVVRRVLASAHLEGEDPGDVGGPWEQRSQDGVTWEQPEGPDVRVEASTGSTVSCATGGPQYAAAPVVGGQWQAAYCGDGQATVVASTQALADVVASTVEGGASVEPPDATGWTPVDALGVVVDLPPGWGRLDTAGCPRALADPARVRFGPEGTDPCAVAVPVDVFGPDAIANQAATLINPGLYDGVSLVASGEAVVVARGDLETKRRVLASVRGPGEDPGDTAAPWVERNADGATWQEPTGADVDVDLFDVDVRCRDVDRSPAVQVGPGLWRATSCVDRAATVTAPTQALADLVASTVRG